MTKSELQTGMIVKTRNGRRYLVVLNHMSETDVLFKITEEGRLTGTWLLLTDYHQNLLYNGEYSTDLDIMEIYSTSLLLSYTNLLWERQEVKEVTMQEVEEKFGCKVKIINNEQP